MLRHVQVSHFGRALRTGHVRSNYVVQLYTGGPDLGIGCGVYEVATGPNIPVYDRPDAKSPVVEHLSYDVILTCILRTGIWARVEYAKGRFGYVLDDKLADPGGLRVTLRKEATGWKIKALDSYFE